MSYTAPNPLPYKSTASTDASPVGPTLKSFPLPPDSTVQLASYAIQQQYQMVATSFPPAPKNTLCTDASLGALIDTDSAANNKKPILTSYAQLSHIGGQLTEFEAMFNVVPATWNDYRVLPFTFPGFPGIIGQTGSRDIFTDKASCRLQYDYYVLDPGNVISSVANGTPGTATSLLDSSGNAVKVVYKLGDIPTIAKSIFVVALSGTPDYSNRTNSLIVSGGAIIGGIGYYQTQPTKTVYQSWMSQALTTGWQGIAWPGTNNAINDGSTGAGHDYTQLVAEDSTIEIFAGNIVARVTMYVLAK